MIDTEAEMPPEAGFVETKKPRRARRERTREAAPMAPPGEGALGTEVVAPATVEEAAPPAAVEAVVEEAPAPEVDAAPTPTRRSRGATRATGFPWEQSPLAGVPFADLMAEVQRRQRRAASLLAERDRVLAQMAQIEADLAAVGEDGPAQPGTTSRSGMASAPRSPRAKNGVSLKDAIAAVVEVRATVTPGEAAELVLKNGYVSTAKNFGQLVAITLAKDERFSRVERGKYERVR